METNIKKEKKINKKRLIIAIIILLLIITAVTLFIIYCVNANFRKWTDKNILQKEIKQGNTISIEFNAENSSTIYAFNKYIVTIENKILKIYNSLGTEEASITTDITNPIFDASGKYLVVAESNGQSIYLLEDTKTLWSNKIEGKITQVKVNENGYVGAVLSDISYKNIVNVFKTDGKSLFKTYIASNKVVDITISRNNQFLAIAEVDLSGVLIQSSIKIIDTIKAKTEPNSSIVNTYSAEIGKLITNIEYQNKERLLCVYSDSIEVFEENNRERLKNLDDSKVAFASIELKNNLVTLEEKNTESNTSTCANITNTSNKKVKTYETEEIAKEIFTHENVIALNFGTELHIINTNGWLIKKYISEQEINKVVISNKIVGIIYRNKIEIVDL